MKLNLNFTPWQADAVYSPYTHFAFYAGVAGGKTYTGSHFAILNMVEHPDLTGFIGSNTYEQLTQVSLRELFYWLDEYKIPWVIDCRPPPQWGARKAFKKYSNILSCLIDGQVVHVFTRTLSQAPNLRGLEFSWYWIDELRDTPQESHDVVVSRLRESKTYIRGLVTTTTNGEGWDYQRFVKGRSSRSKLYGCMHVPSVKSVEYGIISQAYFDGMAATYSPAMAQQELWAEHVNIYSGRAYYAASKENQRRKAPWGDAYPTKDRPLIIGCDFNFSPAPMVWMVGQVGPDEFSEYIHWFGELSEVEIGTQDMALRLLMQYPGFFYRFFGDSSGSQGTTSNAGETDYMQISKTLANAGALFTIDTDHVDPKQRVGNPRVKNRVENMNARFRNALGQIRQTYNPDTCPLFDEDTRMVGWKKSIQAGRGKLDDGDVVTRTHATDGAGYAIWKLFPPQGQINIIPSMPSAIRMGSGLIDDRTYREEDLL